MNRHWNFRILGFMAVAATGFMASPARAELKLPSVIDDNMVLQRDMPIPIWGWADAGQTVAVTFAGKTVSATADKDGKWMVRLPAQKASDKPQTMTIQAGTATRTLGNVLIGEVWLASGQSNMEMPVSRCNNTKEEIASARYPSLRLFTVAKRPSPFPRDDVAGNWVECSPQTVSEFSAAAYFFGRDLLGELKVPVGLIDSSWGGTPIEAWSNPEAFTAAGREKEIQRAKELAKLTRRDFPMVVRKYLEKLTQWEKNANCYDYNNDGYDLGWANPGNDPRQWKDAKDSLKFTSVGAVWFRRTVDIPDAWVGKDLVLELGVIDDYDTTYVNGLEVGKTGKEVLQYWDHARVYRLPDYCVKPGTNMIAVRVFNNYMEGRFSGWGKLYPAQQSANPISLEGGWQYRVERTQNLREDAGSKPTPPSSTMYPGQPCVLYNGMIQPLIPYAIRGVIWYQGEANAGNAAVYRKMLPAMIQSWRDAWGQKDQAFGIVQLANFLKRDLEPSDHGWAELREAQAMTLSVPNTGLAVAIDIGDEKDIHPKNKQDVGKRLALWARAKVYGRKIPYSGPMYRGMKVEGNKIRLSFDHVNGGLVTKDNKPLEGFAVAGKDGKFVWAEAKIDGETVLVWSEKVAEPAAARYAWAVNPACNLYNKANLPAAPFRTDAPK
jgi:sialate O-acetylesterase